MKRASLFVKILFGISAALVGLVFIFSGTVKAIDPLGSAYKIGDYLEVVNLYDLYTLTLVGSFCLFVVEALCGWLLLTRVNFKLGLYLTTAFMAVMTPLTLWIMIANPVSDCGCFGDAIILSNTATFVKNVVIDAFLVVLWVFHKKVHFPWLKAIPAWCVTLLICGGYIIFGVSMLRSLPVVDFRPYKIGVNIEEGMSLPEDAKVDVYRTTCIYRHTDGEEKEFELQEIPYNDESWTFVSQKTELIQKGDEPAIHDFSITELNWGDDITEDVLNEDEVYLFIMWNLALTNTKQVEKLNHLYKQAKERGAVVYALTATIDLIPSFVEHYGIEFDFAVTDPIQLKTIIRANPGVVVLKKGTIVEKFNVRQYKIK